MTKVTLEFEKPLEVLEGKLTELKDLSSKTDVDFDDEIKSLEKKIYDTKAKIYKNLTPWQRVQLARHPERPYSLDYINNIFTDFIELHGDRRFADDAAIVGGFAKLDGNPVMIIGTQKGRDTKENVHRNFGCPHPEGYRKALRLMQLADKANVPIITLIDTAGAFPGIASEERHIGEAIAVNLREMFDLRVPILAIVIGEGGSGGALGIGVGNKIMVMENAYYSVITPEGCAAILWDDRAFTEQAASALKLTATDLKDMEIIDVIVEEPISGAQNDYDGAAKLLKQSIIDNLKPFESMSEDEIKEQRYQKYRDIAVFTENK